MHPSSGDACHADGSTGASSSTASDTPPEWLAPGTCAPSASTASNVPSLQSLAFAKTLAHVNKVPDFGALPEHLAVGLFEVRRTHSSSARGH